MLLITGGAGYIGAHVVLEALEANYEVVVLDDYSNGYLDALERVENLTGKTVFRVEGSVGDSSLLSEIFSSHPISAVIHLAGLKSVSQSVAEPLSYYQTNVAGTMALTEEMLNAGVNRLVFSSSATIYGAPQTLPITEYHAVGNTTNPYGSTKYIAERFLMDICKTRSHFSTTALRYFNPIGAHKSGEIGESPRSKPENLLPYLTQVAIGRQPHLNIYGSDYNTIDGSGVRDYLHVVDLARAHILAVEREHIGYETFNLGLGAGISVLELVQHFELISGLSIPLRFEERRVGDVAECYADNTRAKNVLGWAPKYSLADMLKDAWRWQQKNPMGYSDG